MAQDSTHDAAARRPGNDRQAPPGDGEPGTDGPGSPGVPDAADTVAGMARRMAPGRPGPAARLSAPLRDALRPLPERDRDLFALRLARSREDLDEPLARLYGHLPGFDAFLAELDLALARAHAARPEALRMQDLARDLTPDWFQSERMVGYVFYVDRFSGDLRGILDRVDYLEQLGVTYVHLMPLLRPRPGDSDGGYSVMDYRAVRSDLGTMDDLAAVCDALRERGISVCVDMVLNHTAAEHEWARRAVEGSAEHRAMYRMYETREEPDAFEETLLEVFPDTAPGNFTWVPMKDGGRWVWTTFNHHQWDLNWESPRVFLAIVETMLFLANRGIECLRLDAVAFMWKRLGTTSQNLPQVHDILHALRAATRVAAASVIHKEEAIVSPADLIPYLGVGMHAGDEGNLAYHNSLMVQFWGALATRDTGLMSHVLGTHFPTRIENATWATYLRCHDDIGWAFTDEDVGAMGLSGPAHRGFLARFYEGGHPGSFARGAPFQVNEETGDRRTNGSLASLCGLEKALADGDEAGIARAIDRIVMGHSLIASWAGMPLLYMGDELGLLNDWSFEADPARAHDSRWVHRPAMDWSRAARRHEPGTVEQRVHAGVRHVMTRRKAVAHLNGKVPIEVPAPPASGVFAHLRPGPLGTLVALHNFTEEWRHVPREWAGRAGASRFHDALSDTPVETPGGTLALPPYARLWLV